MAKQLWKAGNMLYPLPAVMVSLRDKNGKDNIITVAWAGTICTNPAMVSISIRKERFSHPILMETKEFVINLTTEDLVWATDYCGVTSGRDVDKFLECKLHKEEASEVNVAMIQESPVNIECIVEKVEQLGSHDIFYGKVVAVHADEKYFDQGGTFHLEHSHPICYSHGTYFSLGKKMGTFGYSVRKKKKKNSKKKKK